MKRTAFVFSAFLAMVGSYGVCAAGEEYMPLVSDTGQPGLRKNIVRLSVPSPGRQPEGRIRMVETPAAAESRRARIPGLVPPELLAVSRMEEKRERARAPRQRGGFTPISLPYALGTEELMEFDPYSVQRTGDPFRDTPGEAEAFPAAATHSQVWGEGEAWNNGVFPFENNGLRPPSAAQNSAPAPSPVASGVPGVAPGSLVAEAEGTADIAVSENIVAPKIHSLRPPSSSAAAVSSAAAAAVSAGSLRPAASAAISAMQPPADPAPTALSLSLAPPLPELEVRSHNSALSQNRRTIGGVVMPPPLSPRDMALSAPLLMPPAETNPVTASLPQAPGRPPVQRGEFSLLMPSSNSEPASGLRLALPPTSLTEGNSSFFSYALPDAPMQVASSADLDSYEYENFERYEDFGQFDPVARQRPALRESITVPALTVEEFTPMRGVKIY